MATSPPPVVPDPALQVWIERVHDRMQRDEQMNMSGPQPPTPQIVAPVGAMYRDSTAPGGGDIYMMRAGGWTQLEAARTRVANCTAPVGGGIFSELVSAPHPFGARPDLIIVNPYWNYVFPQRCALQLWAWDDTRLQVVLTFLDTVAPAAFNQRLAVMAVMAGVE